MSTPAGLEIEVPPEKTEAKVLSYTNKVVTKFLEEVGAGRLKAVNIGRRRLFAVEDIDEYVQLLRAERAEAQRGRD